MNRCQVPKLIALFAILIAFSMVHAASDADWSTPENFSNWQVTLDRPWLLRGTDGTQAVFWLELDLNTNQEELWARVRPPGGEWSTVQRIFEPLDFTTDPEMVIADDGTVWVMWMMPDTTVIGDNMQVKTASWSGSGPWQQELLSEYESAIRNIDLSQGSDGHLVATWVACASLNPSDQGPCAVNIRRRIPGTNIWETIERLDGTTGNGIQYGRSLVGPAGMVVTTWAEASQVALYEWHVMTRAYDPSSDTWESMPVDVSGGVLSNMTPFLAQPVMGADGTVIVSWYQVDPADNNKADLYSVTRQASTGTWNLPIAISNVHDSGMLRLPKLAVGQNGTAVIAWEQKKSSSLPYEFAVFANVRDPGSTWGSPVRISDYLDTVDLSAPQVWANGTTILIWEARDDTRDSKEDETMFWSARLGGGVWGGLGHGQLGSWFDNVYGASLAIAEDGSATVVWAVTDSDLPTDQRAQALGTSWIPGGAPIVVDTLQSDYRYLDISNQGVVVNPDGSTRAAAWLVQRSSTGPSDPDNAIFYVEEMAANTAPTAGFSVTPPTGTPSTNFQFDASTSSDNEDPDSSLEVRWDWQDDGTYDTSWSTTKTATHQFSTAQKFTVRLQVRDSGGLSDSTTRVVTVTSNGSTWSQFLYLPITVR